MFKKNRNKLPASRKPRFAAHYPKSHPYLVIVLNRDVTSRFSSGPHAFCARLPWVRVAGVRPKAEGRTHSHACSPVTVPSSAR